MRKHPSWIAVGIVAASLLLIAGCGSDDSADSVQSEPPERGFSIREMFTQACSEAGGKLDKDRCVLDTSGAERCIDGRLDRKNSALRCVVDAKLLAEIEAAARDRDLQAQLSALAKLEEEKEECESRGERWFWHEGYLYCAGPV